VCSSDLAYAIEPVPAPGDRGAEVRWYWESGHFKSALGHAMLERMQGGGDPGLGRQINPDNLGQHQALIRKQGDAYLATQPEVVRELEQLAH
jgi:hypothetical protein